MNIIVDPKKIEAKSFEIISRRLCNLKLPNSKMQTLRRVIHTTTDFGYVKDLLFAENAIQSGLRAIKKGCNVICDVGMVKAGINKKILSSFGGKVICFISNKVVEKQANKLKIAKAIIAMRKASSLMNGAIIAIGNAPTALFEVCDLIKQEKIKPALIIGVPVGFVGAAEAKKYLASLKIPYITNKSRKGGSPVAATITNALLKLANKKQK